MEYWSIESTPKSHLFWTKVHKHLIINSPDLKVGVSQMVDNTGFSPKEI